VHVFVLSGEHGGSFESDCDRSSGAESPSLVTGIYVLPTSPRHPSTKKGASRVG
jgi:hypothetical protein